jgi:hypothetical protein
MTSSRGKGGAEEEAEIGYVVKCMVREMRFGRLNYSDAAN